MKVLVTGGRNYDNKYRVHVALSELHDVSPIDLVIQGGADGADCWARTWALRKAVRCVSYFADWAIDGKAAGPIRNSRMLKESCPDLVVAFPGGSGTSDTVNKARAAGINVLEVK
jgi:hypothetical protein